METSSITASISDAFFCNFCFVMPTTHGTQRSARPLLPPHPDRQLGPLFPDPAGIPFASTEDVSEPPPQSASQVCGRLSRSDWAAAQSFTDDRVGDASTFTVEEEEEDYCFDYPELPPVMSLDDFLGDDAASVCSSSEDEDDEVNNTCPVDRLMEQIANLVPFSPRPQPSRVFAPLPTAIVHKTHNMPKKLFSVHFEDEDDGGDSTDCESGSTESGGSEESARSY